MVRAMLIRIYVFAVFCALGSTVAQASEPVVGVSPAEIRIGQSMPYSGPISAYGAIGKAQSAYFAKVNAEGGINGRRVKLISLDDGYNPAKAIENARRLVEQEQVFVLFNSVGTATNLAMRKYLNEKKVPHLFVSGGDTAWGNHEHYPWMLGWMPSYQFEGRTYAQHLLKTKPAAKVALLYSNDDYGKDYVKGFVNGLGARAKSMIVAEQTFDWSDPTLNTQIINLHGSGADTLFSAMAGKHASMAIRKIHDLGWRPLHYTGVPSASPAAILAPAGLDRATGLITAYYAKDHLSDQWRDDQAIKDYYAWAKQYYDGDATDGIVTFGYQLAQALEYVLRKAGGDLTRDNVIRIATNMKDVEFPLLLPGIKVSTGASDYYPIEQLQMMRFDGARWISFGEVVSRDAHQR
jgi:branched-chain amino acid transport system substrate-binding protein